MSEILRLFRDVSAFSVVMAMYHVYGNQPLDLSSTHITCTLYVVMGTCDNQVKGVEILLKCMPCSVGRNVF